MRLPALVLTIVAVLAVRRASAEPTRAEVELGDEAWLASVVNLYEAGKYAECASELGAMLAPDARRKIRDRDVLENARIYHAACLIGSGNPSAADKPLRDAILANTQMKPPDSLVLLYASTQWRYDEALGAIVSGERKYPADPVFESGLAHVYRLRGANR